MKRIIAKTCFLIPISFQSVMAETLEVAYKAKSAEILDKNTDFMITAAIGLVAVIGFFIKDKIVHGKIAEIGLTIWLSLYAIASVASLWFGYMSRLEIVGELSYGRLHVDNLTYYSYQAFSLVLAIVFAVVVIFLNWKKT